MVPKSEIMEGCQTSILNGQTIELKRTAYFKRTRVYGRETARQVVGYRRPPRRLKATFTVVQVQRYPH